MQKAVNIIALVLVILIAGTSFIYFNDDMDIDIPYLIEIFQGLALTLGVLFVLKLIYRLQTLMLANKTQGYKVSTLGFRKILVYEGVSLIYFGIFGYLMITKIDIGLWLGIIAVLFCVEGIINFLFNIIAGPYKILVNSQSISLLTNHLVSVKWNQIQKIDSRQNDIHLIRETGSPLLIDLDWLARERQDEFIKELSQIAQEKNIYCSIDCKGEYKDFTKLAMKTKFED